MWGHGQEEVYATVRVETGGRHMQRGAEKAAAFSSIPYTLDPGHATVSRGRGKVHASSCCSLFFRWV
jgi:hypothetical protein